MVCSNFAKVVALRYFGKLMIRNMSPLLILRISLKWNKTNAFKLIKTFFRTYFKWLTYLYNERLKIYIETFKLLSNKYLIEKHCITCLNILIEIDHNSFN